MATMFVQAQPPPAQPTPESRRPNSIFSRRGSVMTSKFGSPTSPSEHAFPASLSENQKRWVQARSQQPKSKIGTSKNQRPKSSTESRGTVLKAVPPAQLGEMIPLALDLTPSPNEEQHFSFGNSSPRSPSYFSKGFGLRHAKEDRGSKNSRPSSRHNKSTTKTDDTAAQIGIWQNGVFRWNEGIVKDHPAFARLSLIDDQTVLAAAVPSPPPNVVTPARPRLTVAIPPGQAMLVDNALASINSQSVPHRAHTVAFSNALDPTLGLGIAPVASPERSQVRSDSAIRVSSGSEGTGKFTASASPWRISSSPSSESNATDKQSHSSSPSSATTVDVDNGAERRHDLVFAPPIEAKRSANSEFSPSRSNTLDGHFDKPLPPIPDRADLRQPTDQRNTIPRVRFGSNGPTLRPLSSSSSPSPDCGGRRRTNKPPPSRTLATRSLFRLDTVSEAFLNSTPRNGLPLGSLSPTLSQAELELETELEKHSPTGQIPGDINVFDPDEVDEIAELPSRAPTLPKRSRKRDWQDTVNATPRLQRCASDTCIVQSRQASAEGTTPRDVIRRCLSTTQVFQSDEASRPSQGEASAYSHRLFAGTFDDGLIVVDGPVVLRGTSYSDYLSTVELPTPEFIRLRILEALPTLADLRNAAIMNKRMYRIYKDNEARIVRQVSLNESPAAWESIQWSLRKQSPGEESLARQAGQTSTYDVAAYLESYHQDSTVIASLKKLTLEKCGTFIRKETSAALSDPADVNASRFNDAFWRIWSFCKIFGGNKDREDDLAGQLDWLKGGPIAHNDDFGATVNGGIEFDMGGVLLNTPDFFGRGNGDGLTADDLYDMLELWTCMTALLEGYSGHVAEARESGVYDCCGPIQGDDEEEENMLEEWILYLLTLGPSVVLDMAEFSGHYIAEGFDYAAAHEWTKWSPAQHADTRNVFLKEPLSRLFQEHVAAATLRLEVPGEKEKKALSRKRVAMLATEIRLARQMDHFQHLPLIDMSMEGSMSPLSRRSTTTSCRSSIYAASTSSMRKSPGHWLNLASPSPTHQKFASASLRYTPRSIGPIPECQSPASLDRSPLQFFRGIADDTSDLAVRAVVNMGFTPSEAREALRMTDLGDGLRVDRAVELLLRQQ